VGTRVPDSSWSPPPAGSEAERRLIGTSTKPRGAYRGSIAAFLVGAVGIAIPYLVLNWRDPDGGNQTGLSFAHAGLMLLGVVVVPILGMVAWRFERRWRGLVAMLAGFAVGGIIGFLPVFLRGAADPNYDDVWTSIGMVVGFAAIFSTVGWCLLGAVAAVCLSQGKEWFLAAGEVEVILETLTGPWSRRGPSAPPRSRDGRHTGRPGAMGRPAPRLRPPTTIPAVAGSGSPMPLRARTRGGSTGRRGLRLGSSQRTPGRPSSHRPPPRPESAAARVAGT